MNEALHISYDLISVDSREEGSKVLSTKTFKNPSK